MKRSDFILLIIILAVSTLILCDAEGGTICLTEEERKFIRDNPVISLGVDPKFIPFEFIDIDGEYKGIADDYMALISKRTGLKFEPRKNLSWPEAYDLALARELDVLSAVGKTAEREKFFILSKPYYFFKRVLVTTNENAGIGCLDDLRGLAVAVQRNSSHHSYLLNYEEVNLSLYDSVESALVAVTTGEEKAFIGNLATTNYLIRSNGLTNLRFVSFEAEKQQSLHFAVRKDWPELVSILNKSIDSITEKEKNEINKKWIDLDTRLDYGPYIRIAILIGTLVSVVLAVSWFWIIRLRKEVAERKRAEVKLQDANSKLEKMTMIDGLTGIFNRRYFDSFLTSLWGINKREEFPIGLIMIDIDLFKNYNDTYGHVVGDQCLKSVAKIIEGALSREGDFVARFGGEEFAVLLSNTRENEAAILAEQIREKVESTMIENEVAEIHVTVSVGVASFQTVEGVTPNDLIYTADCALYKAKEGGRNRVVRASDLPIFDSVLFSK